MSDVEILHVSFYHVGLILSTIVTIGCFWWEEWGAEGWTKERLVCALWSWVGRGLLKERTWVRRYLLADQKSKTRRTENNMLAWEILQRKTCETCHGQMSWKRAGHWWLEILRQGDIRWWALSWDMEVTEQCAGAVFAHEWHTFYGCHSNIAGSFQTP